MTRLVGGLLAVTVALVLADLALNSGGHVPAGTHAAFGVAGCVTILLVAKWLGKHGLHRSAPPAPGGAVNTDE